MDGWLLTDPTMPGDIFPIGYYLEPDLPFYSGVAAEYTICDRYFSGILASTYPNRMYMHLGQTDRLSNDFTIASLPTIWDRLREAGVSRRYYFRDLPFIALTGINHLGISRPYAEFALDARAGLLPSVSYIDPTFLNESPDGTAEDDHPQAHIRKGQVFLNDIYEALRNSPQWERTLLVINYDEWGGFYRSRGTADRAGVRRRGSARQRRAPGLPGAVHDDRPAREARIRQSSSIRPQLHPQHDRLALRS